MYDHLYVLCLSGSEILRVQLPGGEVERVCDAVGYAPDGIVVDEVADRLYWTTMGLPVQGLTDGKVDTRGDFTLPNGSVRSARLDGSDQRVIVPEGAITTGKQLVADRGAGHLYFGDREGCRVWRVDRDGSELTPLVINDPSEGIPAECVGVEVDPDGGWLYWTQKGPTDGGLGRIFRCGIDIPDGETAADRSDIEVLWEGLPEPIDLHLDPAGGQIYWTDRARLPGGNSLNRAPIPAPGTSGTSPEILADGFDAAIGLAIDTEAQLGYVTDHTGSVRQVSLTGASPDRVVAHIEGAILTGIAGAQHRTG